MINKIKTIFSIPELRAKIFYTLSILIVVRVGAHIPIPGVDANALAGAFDRLQDTLFGFLICLLVVHLKKHLYFHLE